MKSTIHLDYACFVQVVYFPSKVLTLEDVCHIEEDIFGLFGLVHESGSIHVPMHILPYGTYLPVFN